MKLDERRILEEAGLIYPDNAVERAVLCKAIGTYGVDAQCKVAIEEMSELTKELCKYFRGVDDCLDCEGGNRMSVYIKGMEMPKEGDLIVIRPDGKAYYVSVNPQNAYERKAVHVPLHGDLIERSAVCLTDFEIAMCGGDYKEGMKMLLEKVEAAPTIIPADKEGEG